MIYHTISDYRNDDFTNDFIKEHANETGMAQMLVDRCYKKIAMGYFEMDLIGHIYKINDLFV